MPDIRIDPRDGTWTALKGLILGEIDRMHRDLETPFLPQNQTDDIRGQIAFGRRLIKTVEPEAQEASGQALDYSVVRAPFQQS